MAESTAIRSIETMMRISMILCFLFIPAPQMNISASLSTLRQFFLTLFIT